MKKYLLSVILLSAIYIPDSFSQAGQWTWMKGDNTTNPPGVYGIQGTANAANTPPGMYEAIEWTDKNGNFWLFSGLNGATNEQSDLWKYDPVANAWTWMKGPGTGLQPGVYGTKGVPSAANNPGARAWGSPTWVDTSGNLWLYGGIGYDSLSAPYGHAVMNDLWKYDVGTNEWTWMAGQDTGVYQAVYGTQGVFNTTNDPGNRAESDASWTDKNGNLWMFGGLIYHGSGGNWSVTGTAGDLWEYDMGTNQWAWIKGPQGVGTPGLYGTQGIANVNNYPPSRESYNKWIDANGDLWLFGGENYNTGHKFNDLWRYNIPSNTWTWMSGTNIPNDSATIATTCSPSTSIQPQARHESRASFIDACGNFWLMGGQSASPGYIVLNDLWKYDPKTNEWTWVNGQNGGGTPAFNYGTQGVSSASNLPPRRMGNLGWADKSGNFWTWGGGRALGLNQNDLWRFVPDTICTGGSCNSVIVAPVAALSSSATSICADKCTNFNNLSVNSTSWLWTFQGGMPSSSTVENPQTICYLDSGSFSVTLIAYNASQSDTAIYSNYIKVNPAPPTPNVRQSHDTLICSTDPSYTSYQWYSDSTLISGATSPDYVFTNSGNYNVSVSSENGCSIAAGITVVGIKEFSLSGLGFTLSPNPATNKLLVSAASHTGSLLGKGNLKIYDALGKVCLQSEITNPKFEIDVSSLSQGIYFVEIQVDSDKWIGKFFKE